MRNVRNVARCHGFAPRSDQRALCTGPGTSLVSAREHQCAWARRLRTGS
jgi:hypothetical protein